MNLPNGKAVTTSEISGGMSRAQRPRAACGVGTAASGVLE